MANNGLEVQERDCYCSDSPNFNFNRILFQVRTGRPRDFKKRYCKVKGGACSCPEASDFERGHCQCHSQD